MPRVMEQPTFFVTVHSHSKSIQVCMYDTYISYMQLSDVGASHMRETLQFLVFIQPPSEYNLGASCILLLYLRRGALEKKNKQAPQ